MRTLHTTSLLLVPFVAALAFTACGGTDERTASIGDGGQNGMAGSGTGSVILGSGGDVACIQPPCGPASGACGDAILDSDEACDDGNTEDGDGCHADCLGLDPGYLCPFPGQACRPIAHCGDGIVSFPEQCDDGNTTASDGCSLKCKIELGFKCEGDKSVCTPTVCGDDVVEGVEGCDDGNVDPFDGCNALCQTEPTCGASGCTSECGDGLVLGEECDDGNTVSGDGCSADCAVEPGSDCSGTCEMVGDKCVIKIPVIYRDFLESHSDFQPDCHSEVEVPGVVESTLGPDGKPVRVQNLPGNTCISNFQDWYYDKAGINSRVLGELVLFDNGSGGFVNRWKPDGTQFTSLTQELKDGDPFFFPIDNQGITQQGEYGYATTGKEYTGTDGYTGESQWVTNAPKHNFHFTSQIQYWFGYDATQSATLAFTGDDDVWVFVNGHLVVDLGGLHLPRSGSVTISSANAGTYGLEDGKVYPISIFHAERKKDGSSFRLTLSGFSMARSECASQCGDGIIGVDEQCDDGDNVGGYNKCQPGCVLGGYCGDGIVQPEEDCDYRAPDAPVTCNGCRIIEPK